MANSPLAIRPNPHSVTAPTIITMSSPTATSDAQSPARARRPSMAEALAASADLEEALVSPTTTEHRRDSLSSSTAAGDEAERARTATEAWKPAMNRRLSWNREEQKRSLQMGSIADVTTGPGFTERSATA